MREGEKRPAHINRYNWAHHPNKNEFCRIFRAHEKASTSADFSTERLELASANAPDHPSN